MSLTSSAGLLALALLATSPKATELSPLDECETASARIELTAEPTATPPVVCISPGLSLTLRFDTPLRPESVKTQERFEEVNPGQKTLTLVPLENLEAGERFKLEVCFADTAAPTCASILLVAHPALGMHQVKVFRQPRPLASYQEAEKVAQADAQQCREEVRQLRAGYGAPEGLRGALASGLLEEKGIRSRNLTDRVTEHKGNALRQHDVHSYRAQGRVAVEVKLKNPGTEPWTAMGAVLRGPKGEVLRPLPLWQQPVLPREAGADGPEQWHRVVVEVLASETEAQDTYTLTLWDADKHRTVILGNVTFP